MQYKTTFWVLLAVLCFIDPEAQCFYENLWQLHHMSHPCVLSEVLHRHVPATLPGIADGAL